MAEAALVDWRPDGGWAGIGARGRSGRTDGEPGVTVELLDDRPLASLLVPSGNHAAFARRMSERFGVEVPRPGRLVRGQALDLIWAGRDHWLARSLEAGLSGRLVAEVGEVASVSDQTSSRAMLRLGGPRVRDALAKGCAVDLHPATFAVGAVAATAIAHVGVLLWRPDEADFEAAVPRSYAGSFWSWLAGSASEFGLDVARSP